MLIIDALRFCFLFLKFYRVEVNPSRLSYLRFIMRLYMLRSHRRLVSTNASPMASIMPYVVSGLNMVCSVVTMMLV